MPPRHPSGPPRQPRMALALPKIVPVRPVRRAEPFDDPEWVFEPKFDGFRGIAYVTPEACALRSRNDNEFRQFAELAGRIRQDLEMRSAILDGEVVALDGEGKVSFELLMRRQGTPVYAVFDLMWLNGRDLRPMPQAMRRQLLERAVPHTPSLLRVMSVNCDGKALLRATESMDFEGIVAKRAGDPYRSDTVWYKILNSGYSQKAGRAEWFHRQRG